MWLTSTGAVGDRGAMLVVPAAAVGDHCRGVAGVDRRLWVIALGMLPTSSGALPGTCWPLLVASAPLLEAGAGVGEGTRPVVHVVWRVVGSLLAVAGRTWYVP